MSKKDKAMKLALEALAVRFSEGWHEGIKIDASDIMLLNDAAQALAEQPAQQEPVATVVSESGNPNVSMSWWHEPALPVGAKLYTSPPAQQEPVPCCGKYKTCTQACTPRGRFLGKRDALAEQPAQRTWVGLTDEDKHYLNDVLNLQGRFPVIDAIEAKLREKNT